MSFTLTGSGAITRKAGANVNSTLASSGSIMEEFCDEAEAFIAAYTRFDWVTNYPNLNGAASMALQEAASNLAALNMIAYDMSGFPNRAEAESRINFLHYKAFRVMDELKKDPNRQFVIDGATGVS